MSEYLKGLLLTVVGVLIITPDSLLIRLLEADSWTVIFWRNSLSGLAIFIGLLIYYRGDFFKKMRGIGWAGLIMGVIWALGTFCFVYSIQNTLVANTLFIVSTSPIFAALIAWLILGEIVSRRTWLTIAFSLCGIAIIAWGSLEGDGQGSIVGDLAALVTALAVAISFSIARRNRSVSMIPAIGLSSIMAGLVAFPLAMPIAESIDKAVPILLLGLVVAPIGMSLLVIGPRYLPAADVSLLLLLEAVLGPLWVWWMLKEFPGIYTLIGGAFVLLTLAISNAIPLIKRQTHRPHQR
ncbi:MAG: DMT family transporter [Leucothrix sp.]